MTQYDKATWAGRALLVKVCMCAALCAITGFTLYLYNNYSPEQVLEAIAKGEVADKYAYIKKHMTIVWIGGITLIALVFATIYRIIDSMRHSILRGYVWLQRHPLAFWSLAIVLLLSVLFAGSELYTMKSQQAEAVRMEAVREEAERVKNNQIKGSVLQNQRAPQQSQSIQTIEQLTQDSLTSNKHPFNGVR